MLNVNQDTCRPGYNKIYIEVLETVTPEGKVLPQRFKWVDGNNERHYDIDKILEIKQTYAPNVSGREKYLWYEGPAWFVEMYVKRL